MGFGSRATGLLGALSSAGPALPFACGALCLPPWHLLCRVRLHRCPGDHAQQDQAEPPRHAGFGSARDGPPSFPEMPGGGGGAQLIAARQ